MNKKYLMATTLMTALLIAAGCQKKPRVAELGAPTGPQVIEEATEEGTDRTQQGVQYGTDEAEYSSTGCN